MNTLFKKKKLPMAVFVAPTIILFGLIIVIPLIQSAVMGFTEWDGINKATFIGLKNYQKLLKSRDLSVAIRNSVLFSVVLTLYQVGIGTVLAYIIANFKFRGRNFFKNVYFFPVLLSVSVVAQLWISIYHGDFGLINQMAKTFGSSWQQNWLNEPIKGIIAVTITEGWKGMGYHMLLIYAAMKNVPEVYYEAATIDGANKKNQFFHITLPLTVPTIKVSVVMCITFGFRAFEMIYLMTGGGPGNYSTTLPIMMYESLFGLQKYGYGSAIAVVIVILCVGLMLLINKLTARFDQQY
ncbi:sugar ABC transporter permease [Blautia hominis]|uniref:Sugar ABC transporter permease n=1 Tax=Blautia hominis TaxID=2025493 RepID=A0ABQ0BE16_9FIRM